DEELLILSQNTMVKAIEEFEIGKVLKLQDILEMQKCVKRIQISEEVKQYIVNIVESTRVPDEYGIRYGEFIKWGASPRASINLALAARATALMNGRAFVIPGDIRVSAHEVFRHRIGLNYEGKARGVDTDEIIDSIIKNIPVI
ncbi:MAG: hypothetical protein KAU03_06725, partial [Candidatus Altiarchaeales archaeon]|nr:hypothetical protein [Candidatus Altiarchaeales archaeon]